MPCSLPMMRMWSPSLYMGSTSVLQNYASVTVLHEVLVEFPLEL